MEIVGLIVGIIGALSGVAGVIYARNAIKEAKRIASRQEEQQQELTRRQAEYQRRVNALLASIELRKILSEWYETIRQNINPNRSPKQILLYIEEGYKIRHFEGQFDTQIRLIRAANEVLCKPILKQADIFYHTVISNKDLVVKMVMVYPLDKAAGNPNLNRLYNIIKQLKEAGQEPNRELCEEYVEAARKEFQRGYFGVDEELGRAIELLSKEINQTS